MHCAAAIRTFVPCALLCTLCTVFIGCDSTLDTFVDAPGENPYYLFGVLDQSADTQFVRVAQVRRTFSPSGTELDATVTAPFEGLVSRRLVDNFSTVAAGQPIARLQDVSELRVAIQVPETVLALVDETDPREMTARFPFLPDQTFALEFRELVAEPDQASQTYTALFALPSDIPANILPGMTANVRIIIEPDAEADMDAVHAPVSALSAAPDGGFVVFVYDPSTGEVASRRVGVGPVTGETVLIETGLAAGEQIVTAGVTALHDGMRVRPLERSRTASSLR